MGQIVTGDGGGSADSIHWCSPLWVTNGSKQVFDARPGRKRTGVDLDPCANPGSIPRIGARVNLWLPRNDGLADDWAFPIIGTTPEEQAEECENAYVNPPFGRYYFHPVTRDVMSAGDADEKALDHLHYVQAEADRSVQEILVEDGVAGVKREIKKLRKLKKKAFEAAKAKVLEGYDAYSIADWIEKIDAMHQQHGMDIMFMGPASLGTTPWQNIVIPHAAAILAIKGRPRFELVDFETMQVVSVGDPAPMDCAISLWTKHREVLNAFGNVFAQSGRVLLTDVGRGLL